VPVAQYIGCEVKTCLSNTTVPQKDFTLLFHSVPDLGEGVCANPVNGGAILGKGGPDPQGGNKERQLSPDKGREKT
jgi:hypothetical protein